MDLKKPTSLMTLRLQTTHNAIVSVEAGATLVCSIKKGFQDFHFQETGLLQTQFPDESVSYVKKFCNLNMIGLYLTVSLCSV